MKAALLLIPLLCTVGCAYTNPTQPTPAAPSTTSPASLTMGVDRGGWYIDENGKRLYDDEAIEAAVEVKE